MTARGRAFNPLSLEEKQLIEQAAGNKHGVHAIVAALKAMGYRRSHETVRTYMRERGFDSHLRHSAKNKSLHHELTKAALEYKKAVEERGARDKKLDALYGDARYTDEPVEVWKSRTRQPVFVRPPAATRQTLGGVTGALA